MRARINRKEGIVSIVPETFEDLWHIYKLVTAGSFVKAHSTRKYKPSGSNKEERISVNVTLDADKAELHKHSNSVRITGKIVEIRPEEIAPLGAYHTIDVGVGDEVHIRKGWKEYELDMISEAVKASKRAIVSIVLVDNEMATFASLKQYGIEFWLELENRAKKKDKDVDTGEFFAEIIGELAKIEGLIILGGPGFTKENLLKKIKSENAGLAKRIRLVNASNAERSGVYEVVKSEEMHELMEYEHMHTALRDIERFLRSASRGDGLSAYGKAELERAVEMSAIEVLIILDSLVRQDEFYERLLDKAKERGGVVRIVPTESQAAEQIKAFGGAIAILRYKMDN